MAEAAVPARRLKCAGCACSSDESAHGWRAYLARGLDDEEDREVEIVSLCPDCDEREFGWLPF